MVFIFLTLSGSFLSYKPLQLSRKQDTSLLFDNVASRLFHHAPRLFLIVLPVMLITTTFGVYYRCYSTGRPSDGTCSGTEPPLGLQPVGTMRIFVQRLDPFRWGEFHPPMVPQLWKLPMVFRGLVVLLMLVLALGNAKPVVVMILLLPAASGPFHFTCWDPLLFVCGGILAELQILRKSSPCTLEKLRRNSALVNAIRLIPAIFWVAILAPRSLRRFLACKPSMPIPQLPTHLPIHSCTIQCSLASTVFLDLGRHSHAPILLENFEPLQKPFVTPLANYFGDISFGFYIGHFPFLQTIGRCHVTTMRCTGNPSFGIRSSRPDSS